MGQLFEVFAKCSMVCHTFLILIGATGCVLASMGSSSCQFLEIRQPESTDNGGMHNGIPFVGTAGLWRLQNTNIVNTTVAPMEFCQFYDPEAVNDEVNLQIATFSGWAAPIAAAVGVLFGIVHVLVLPTMYACIILSYGSSFVFMSLTFFLKATSLCGADCSISTGAYFTLSAMACVAVPGGCILFSPPAVPPLAKMGVRGAEDMALGGQGEDETDEEYAARKNAQEMAVIGRVARMAVTGGL
mmetsp:Transcript_18606/g.30833  ORF Transcript_18606/g.30833 Transcript_18606/m.30833 type:complete len:243 (-) Transcript_18606:87-815(-)|eukprot:CAMPEP_0119024006 /NCGR_PEP_ID=MMETSP1176-20130426/31084_1 /TAXON_ID=265551 /ORGANISM="Synedropsis recta cf, Strain CCMP1620" /LENGTH=242 /DNA_ID=CAMNT_0006979187 /DNA_START=258 /DNA_END=986 /DNA_ORIENTATION=+